MAILIGLSDDDLLIMSAEEWLTYLNNFVNSVVKPLDVTAFMDIVEKYVQAERDYLCELLI